MVKFSIMYFFLSFSLVRIARRSGRHPDPHTRASVTRKPRDTAPHESILKIPAIPFSLSCNSPQITRIPSSHKMYRYSALSYADPFPPARGTASLEHRQIYAAAIRAFRFFMALFSNHASDDLERMLSRPGRATEDPAAGAHHGGHPGWHTIRETY